MGFNSNMYVLIICMCYTDEGKSAENIVKAYLSGIFTHKGGSIVFLSDNGTELKMQSSLIHVNNLA